MVAPVVNHHCTAAQVGERATIASLMSPAAGAVFRYNPSTCSTVEDDVAQYRNQAPARSFRCDPATPESATSPTNGDVAPPALLFELEPWHRVFFRNLGDLLLRRQPPPVEITAQPVPLRPGYFIRTGIDAYRFAESYAGHIAFIIVVYLVCTLPFFNRPPKLQSPFENTKVEYYPVSEYLPPINTASEAPVKPRQGAPKLARQEILSVPPQAGQQSPDHRHAAQGQAGSRRAAAQHRRLDAGARRPTDSRLGAFGFAVEGSAV